VRRDSFIIGNSIFKLSVNQLSILCVVREKGSREVGTREVSVGEVGISQEYSREFSVG
jgi:hypothetical protein